MEGRLRCPGLALSLLRPYSRATGERPRAYLLRAFLERLRRRSQALDPRGGPARLRQGVRAARTDDRRIRLLQVIPEDGGRLRRARQDPTRDAGGVDRWRESERRRAGCAGEAHLGQPDHRDHQELGPLDDGGEARGDHRGRDPGARAVRHRAKVTFKSSAEDNQGQVLADWSRDGLTSWL